MPATPKTIKDYRTETTAIRRELKALKDSYHSEIDRWKKVAVERYAVINHRNEVIEVMVCEANLLKKERDNLLKEASELQDQLLSWKDKAKANAKAYDRVFDTNRGLEAKLVSVNTVMGGTVTTLTAENKELEGRVVSGEHAYESAERRAGNNDAARLALLDAMYRLGHGLGERS